DPSSAAVIVRAAGLRLVGDADHGCGEERPVDGRAEADVSVEDGRKVARYAWSRRVARRLRGRAVVQIGGQCDGCGVVFVDVRGGAKVFFAFRSSSFSPPMATTSSVTPVTSANAAISASTASAPAPGSAKMTIPKTIDTRPVRTIDAVSRGSSGSRNDAATARIPSATA